MCKNQPAGNRAQTWDPDGGSQRFHPWASLENLNSPLFTMLRKYPKSRNMEVN